MHQRTPQFDLTKRECEAMKRSGGPTLTPNRTCKQVKRLGRHLSLATKSELRRQYDEYLSTGIAPAKARRAEEESAQQSLSRSWAAMSETGLRTAEMYGFDDKTKTGNVDCPFCGRFHYYRPSGPVECSKCNRRFRATPPESPVHSQSFRHS